MARYDEVWNRGWMTRYDAGLRGGPERGWGPRGSYGGGAGTGQPNHSFTPSLRGPERYGLGPYHQRLRTRRRDDDELRAEVEEALFFDTWVDAEAIQVEVREGVVTLRGDLPTYEEIRYATDDAWEIDGVVGVRSELTLRGR